MSSASRRKFNRQREQHYRDERAVERAEAEKRRKGIVLARPNVIVARAGDTVQAIGGER